MNEANEIFFNTLQQYTTDATAGAAIVAAISDVLKNTPTLITAARDEAQTNLRWFASRDEWERIQIFALAAAVNKYTTQTEGRARKNQKPAAARLDCLQLAAALYRFLKKKKSEVSRIVQATTIRTRAAYKAIIKSNLAIINQLRQVKRTRNWSTISAALETITGQRIPPTTLAKIHAEVTEEIRARANDTPPRMSHFANERISDEMRTAYEKAGYENIENV